MHNFMAEEKFDILNIQGEKTGEVRTKDDAHAYGLIHRTAHVWFVNSKGQLLLQKRQKGKIAYPNLWDISAAGHISAGQSSLEAAIRETEEELGVLLPPTEFKFLFTVEEHIVINEGTHINNEFQDVYLVHCDFLISDFKIQADELQEIRWIDQEDFKKWVKGEGETLVPHHEEHMKLLEYLAAHS